MLSAGISFIELCPIMVLSSLQKKSLCFSYLSKVSKKENASLCHVHASQEWNVKERLNRPANVLEVQMQLVCPCFS